MKRSIVYFVILVACGAALTVQGCTKKTSGAEEVVVTINDEPVYMKDLNRALVLNHKRDPMFRVTPETFDRQLDILIDRHLLIQEAVESELDRTERFLSTIKTFWEQTLIRDLMAYKDREIKESIEVSEEEVADYYEKLSHKKTFKLIRTDDKELVKELLAKEPEELKWQETVGPVGYSDISSSLLKKAFTVPAGRERVFLSNGQYFLIYVSNDEAIDIPPLEEIKSSIVDQVKNIKKADMFDNWLKGIREKANIKVNDDIVKGMKYRHE
jgi:hypothetical protein